MGPRGKRRPVRDKFTPHYSLEKIQRLVGSGRWFPTTSALKSAASDFGWLEADIGRTVLGLSGRQFVKSMTSKHDYRIWQDVYHADVDGRQAYVKLQIDQDDAVVISFKKR
jgi:motility quorum-sensing regulator/GCU-specific mRNA interferase toxin